jgi:acyl-CoA synthetase (AMP-forming)/AMP-acid ligase II
VIGLSVADVLANSARAVPSRTAVAIGDESLTFAALSKEGGRFAAGLQRHEVGRGDLVLVVGTVALDMVVAFAGAARAGTVFAPVDPRLDPATLDRIVALAEPALIVSSAAHVSVGAELAARARVPHHAVGEVLVDAAPAPVEIAETDPHVVFFTSGTTGRPKGVVLTHRVSVLRSHPGSQLEPRGVAVCPYPLFHMAGWTLSMQQWHARDGIVVLPRADAADIVDAVTAHGATRLNAIPGVWRRIVDHLATAAGGEPSTLDSLRFADTGTYATPPDLLDAITAAAPNAHVRVFYGSTEVGNVTALDHDDIADHPASCGVPSPLVEVRLGDGGELQVRTPVAFDRYLDDPGSTAAAHDGEWFRTGDVASVSDDGFVSIVGRLGTVIRTGGESVSPEQVEGVLAGHPAISDVAVVGLADGQWGEVVTAAVVPTDAGEPPTLDELRSACEVLAPHARPRRREVVDSIPRTAATGQVDRVALRARLDGTA